MLVKNKNFNLQQIAESGQCFRMNQIAENKYSLIAYDRYLELEQIDEEEVELSCSEEEYELIWRDYFDLDYDYQRIIDTLLQGKDGFLKEAAEFGYGIRILKQDFFEMMISFIISQNKNIPGIKSCIEAICKKYGNYMVCETTGVSYYSFPAPEALAQADLKDLRELKVGYRDAYILSAAKAVAEGQINLSVIKNCSYEEAKAKLMAIHGIGEKVANCICLYGLHHIGVFPVDVWIKRILKEIYQDEFNIRQFDGYMGIVQQYMFYYMRNKTA